jgi:hypothetical protein
MVMFVYVVLKDLPRLHRDIDALEFIYLMVTHVFHAELVTYIATDGDMPKGVHHQSHSPQERRPRECSSR